MIARLGFLPELPAVAQALTEGLVARVPLERAALYVSESVTGPFTLRAGAPVALEPGAPAVLPDALALWLRAAGRTIVVPESAAGAPPEVEHALTGLRGDRTAALVPLFLDGELGAILALGAKRSGARFDEGELAVLEMLLDQTALALRHADLARTLRGQLDDAARARRDVTESATRAALGALSERVAREINNPLMVIIGHGELLLREEPPGSTTHRRAGKIVTHAHAVARIVRALFGGGESN